jgi:5,10-methylene-tetrahydrofolate dehydrogenase/methenyl tetrahydrofolate cyclohydrolase
MSSDGGLVIDGNAISKELKEQLKAKVAALASPPGLAVVLVGDRKDSATYVNMKKKACAAVGIASFDHNYPADVTQATLIALINTLNADPKVNGILVQLPLPEHVNTLKVLDQIDPAKDVDGIHAVNMGKLAVGSPDPGLLEPCTPKGVIHLLKSTGVAISGKRACVVGRSNIVGKPVSLMLLRENATVTVCHSKTPPETLEAIVRESDIVVAACGRPELIKGAWIKKGAVVIDVGINSVDDPSSPKGYKLVGDVEFNVAKQNASHITPGIVHFA